MAGVGNSGGGGSKAVKAGAAYVQLFAEDNRVYRALDKLKRRFERFGSVAIKAGGALGAAGVLALSPIKPALDALEEQAKLADLAQVFNLNAEAASRLFGIMGAAGSDLRDAQEGLATFNQRIDDAIAGKGEEAVDLFKKLGVSASEFANLGTDQRFYKLLDIIRAMPPETNRLNVLMKAVGEDTGKNLSRTLNLTAAEMRELGDAFEQSSGDLEQARKSSFAYTIAVAKIGAVWREVVNAIAPAVQDVAAWVGRVTKPIAAFARENRALILTAFGVGAGLLVAGAAVIGLGFALKAAGLAVAAVVFVFKALAVTVGFLLSPVGLVTAAVVGLGYVLLTQTAAGKSALADLGGVMSRLGATFRDTWGGIADAVKAGNLELAFKVAGAGVKVVWYDLLSSLKQGWNDFLASIVRSLPKNPLLGGALVGGFVPLALGVEASPAGVAGALSLDTKAEREKLDRAKAELAALIEQARAEAGAVKPAAAPTYVPGAQAAGTIAGSQGSFSARQAAQRFGMPDKVPVQQLKVQQKIEKNTAIAAGVGQALVKLLAFK